MLMTMYLTNWAFRRVLSTNDTIIHMSPLSYNSCGCYSLESIFHTTLQCFYNQQCTDSTNAFKSIKMSFLSRSRFTINQTIESLVNELMTEEVKYDIDYRNYFDGCSPSLCIYSYIDEANVIEGVTKLIGWYGSLVRLFVE
ncbi:unnamed protein product [Adineta ricciae]|uniref:Uncharacterized protein n=1 Tax=Adineta ricciae TaxID=249248 RepID=A0A815UM61_ADIRI|nr:unnamed protein product [Adineta ricciae]CAF1515743.1 unnamed protein product [Adineta ricciae]